MREILIASFDMEVGGVERSLINLLDNFDYENNQVDLFLYRQQGDFMKFLNSRCNLLNEIDEYSTFRKSIKQIFLEGKCLIAISRILANINANIIGKINSIDEVGYYQMQLMWKYSMLLLPKIDKEYDVAISYLWPHYFIANKVKAKKKIAWIHTDYSKIETDIKEDLKVWNKFNYIISVSEECKNSFEKKYPSLKDKVKVMENITSPEFVRKMADEYIEEKFEGDKFNIVSVGRLCYAKGIDNAVRSLKSLHDKGLKNIKWYVVGYGGDEELIKGLIKEHNLEDSFILLGKKTNPYPYMKACDLYVQPSRYEGKAVTVTEAQILGKPVMITNYTTAKSQVKDKVNGYISELNVEGIAYGIEELIKKNESRLSLSNNCKKSNFNNSNELDKLYELFN
ncbi:glycosyltransferase [Clostridium sp. NSJ-6]|uniref:Glycosyltransferase n=1 Tax=Clostridium hominis TaxID=2763036 RepID=A0ABR7DFT0_9CLOT|nr:glycosyltransferase [Clostridium hominis]MBC5630270.1 glycosyltransferase [Clostridium hominis]